MVLRFAAAASAAAVMLFAEESMWTFDNPPTKQLEEKYHFTPTQAWLDHVRLSSVRMNDGGSGSFISPHGLLLTNHHVARGQLQKSSTAEHDYIRDGFLAATQADEIKAPDLEVNVLVSLENVTDRVNSAVNQAAGVEAQFAARKSIIARIERESQQKTGLRSDVITLYQGGEYWLYRYKKYTDLRIVFAPEAQTAFFGGDPDNFTYPRYDLDLALFRVYENGKPIDSTNYLKWNPRGAQDGELVFVSGNPASTQRLDTVAQLEFERNTREPLILNLLKSRVAALQAYSARGPEQARQAGSMIFGLQNSIKAYEGRYRGLQDPALIEKKQKEEQEFRALVAAKPELQSMYGGAWDEIARAEQVAATRIRPLVYEDLDSTLFNIARTLVDYVVEIKKPDGQRLPGFHDAQLDSLRFRLFSPAPVYPEFEKARLAASLELAAKELPADDPVLKTALDGRTPRQAAEALVDGSKLADPNLRKQLIEGGQPAVDSSTDSMIVLARKLDAHHREMVRWVEDNVDSVEQRAGEQLGKARFAVYGKTTYPDATFTLRFSYGAVKGYPMNGTIAPPITTFYGLYDRSASFGNKPPFNLPERWVKHRDELDLSTPFDFVTTNDIIGGNSGSPVINRAGEIVGLIFDGNIESLPGDFVYQGETNRAVAVHTAAMTEALKKLYHAQNILDEILDAQ
jgi:hypothetical protein